MDALRIDGLTKTYTNGRHSLKVLQDVSFTLAEGDSCSIVGPSGSGKTTLLGLCAGLDGPSSGTVNLLDIMTVFARKPAWARVSGSTQGHLGAKIPAELTQRPVG